MPYTGLVRSSANSIINISDSIYQFNRIQGLANEIREQVFDHIRENAINKDIYIDFINDCLEHVHCLISLGSGQNIDKIIML